MKELEFYDVKSKEKFKSSDYRIEEKKTKTNKTRKFAVAKSPSGTHECWRTVKADFVP